MFWSYIIWLLSYLDSTKDIRKLITYEQGVDNEKSKIRS